MTLLQVLAVLAVVAAVGVVAAGLVSGRVDPDAVGLPEPVGSLPVLNLPVGRLEPADVDDVRFSIGLRGYRMDEVDAVLDRLRDQVAEQEQQITALRASFARYGSHDVVGPSGGQDEPADHPDGPSDADSPQAVGQLPPDQPPPGRR